MTSLHSSLPPQPAYEQKQYNQKASADVHVLSETPAPLKEAGSL